MATKGKGGRSKAGANPRKRAPSAQRAELRDPIPMVEVVCPSCSNLFKAPEEAVRGACPFCRKNLRFAEVEEFEEVVPAPSTNGHAVPTDCPVCGTEFRVAATATQATCPDCATELKLSDEPPAAIGRVECPRCTKPFESPLDQKQGRCPHCGMEMEFEDSTGPSRARVR